MICLWLMISERGGGLYCSLEGCPSGSKLVQVLRSVAAVAVVPRKDVLGYQ